MRRRVSFSRVGLAVVLCAAYGGLAAGGEPSAGGDATDTDGGTVADGATVTADATGTTDATGTADATDTDGATDTGDVVVPPDWQEIVVDVTGYDPDGAAVDTANGMLFREGLIVPLSALDDVARVSIRSWDGRQWSSDELIALHPRADLARLAVRARHLVPFPTDPARLALPMVVELRGGPRDARKDPEGRSRRVAALQSFEIDGLTFVALSAGLEDGASVHDEQGRTLGLSFVFPAKEDTDEANDPRGYFVSHASLLRLVEARTDSIRLSQLDGEFHPPHDQGTEADRRLFQAALLWASGDYASARAALERARDAGAARARVETWRGRTFLSEESFVEASAAFARALEDSGGIGEIWRLRGVALNQAGRYDEAIRAYRRALEIEPGDPTTRVNLGSAYYNLGHAEEAQAAYERAIQDAPDFGLAYFNLGVLLAQLGRFAKAEEIYRGLEGKDPVWAERLRDAIGRLK